MHFLLQIISKIRFYLYGKVKGKQVEVSKKYIRLFCYGMLKRGQGLSQQLEDAGGRFYAPCRVYDYTLYETYGVAVMVKTDSWTPEDPCMGFFVDGELWTIPIEILPMLDQVEGGYDRVEVQVSGTDRARPLQTEAYAYVDNDLQPSWRWIGARWGT